MRRLCTICARGGSKGLPGKNLRELFGKPLLAHTIDQARQSGMFAALAVSSDDPAILHVADSLGVDTLVQRPAALATDTVSKLPAIQHCVEEAQRHLGETFTVFVDLDVTAPLRLPEDIVGALNLLEQSGVTNVITGTPARRSPYFNLVETDAHGVAKLSKQLVEPIVRRQDAPPAYDMNASIYAWRTETFLSRPAVFYADTLLYVMPAERSTDIDSEIDFELVKLLFVRRSDKSRTA